MTFIIVFSSSYISSFLLTRSSAIILEKIEAKWEKKHERNREKIGTLLPTRTRDYRLQSSTAAQ